MKWLARASETPPVAGERPAGERSGAWTVAHAARALATGCFEAGRPLPEVGAVALGPDSVLLRLTTPDGAPPQGWAAEQSGRAWRAPLSWVRVAPVNDRLPEPFPLLVSVGASSDGRVLLNLARAAGMVSLDGDGVLARAMVRSWSRRLTTAPWAAGTRVIRVGFEPDPDFAGLDLAHLAEAGPALDVAEGGVLLFADPPGGRDLYQVDRLLTEPVLMRA
jgi:hypothetical protein